MALRGGRKTSWRRCGVKEQLLPKLEDSSTHKTMLLVSTPLTIPPAILPFSGSVAPSCQLLRLESLMFLFFIPSNPSAIPIGSTFKNDPELDLFHYLHCLRLAHHLRLPWGLLPPPAPCSPWPHSCPMAHSPHTFSTEAFRISVGCLTPLFKTLPGLLPHVSKASSHRGRGRRV